MARWPSGGTKQPSVPNSSQAFGAPRPNGRIHEGVDFIGYPDIYAILPGTVTWAGYFNGTAGNGICYKPDGFNGRVEIRHFHPDGWRVSKGGRVNAGDRIGSVGQTGNATADVDHFEVVVDGRPVDPIAWVLNNTGGAATGWPATTKYGYGFVKIVQDLLKHLGHDIGDTDGRDGPKTRKAVSFEQGMATKNGYGKIGVDGVAGPDTLTYLLWANIQYKGGANTAFFVSIVQRLLNEIGHGLAVDGVRGPKTIAAIKHEQNSAYRNGYGRLAVDGIAGFQTVKYLVWVIIKWRLPFD
jgi:peptidoglycan hydrolase-like protein with peptidoglycan-binding domain